jgi:hypothetical protein
MSDTVPHATISQLIPVLEQLTQAITAQVAPLSHAQLNWKPNATDWSVGQCLEHILIANQSYIPLIEQILTGRKKPQFWERLPLVPALWGRLLIASLNPDRLYQIKTAKVFEPTLSAVEPQILATFSQQQQQLVDLMQKCVPLDAARIIVTSPAVSFITYSLLDAFRIIVVHEQHHVAHLAKLCMLPEFPRP